MNPLSAQTLSAPSLKKAIPVSSFRSGVRIETIDRIEDLPGIAEAWDDLAQRVAVQNVFHERWVLEPAWREFGGTTGPTLVLVYGSANASAPAPLLAIFPLTLIRKGLLRVAKKIGRASCRERV